MAEFKRCKSAFAVTVDGIVRVVSAGELVSTDDPAYTKHTKGQFEDLATHVGQQTAGRAAAAGKPVERASADPGEPRDLTPPAVTGPFDPGEHNVPDVMAYLVEADEDEVVRVLAAEEAGKNRAGIVGKQDEVLARFEGKD